MRLMRISMGQLTSARWPLGIKPDAWLRPLDAEDQRAAGEALQQALRSARRPLRPASEREKLQGRTEAAKAAAIDTTAAFAGAAKVRLAVGGRGAYAGAVLTLLRDAPERLSAAQIRLALKGLPRIGPMLFHYARYGFVEQSDGDGAHLYAITAKGRAHLAKAR